MLDLASIPFLSDLPAAGLAKLRGSLRTQRYATGDVVVRRGSPGLAFHVIAAGAAAIDLEPDAQGRPRRVMLGAGQTLGEMAILSGLPVSATVTVIRELTTYSLDKHTFLTLLDEYPILYKRVTELLIDRLRHRTSTRPNALRAQVAVLTFPPDAQGDLGAGHALLAGVQHYAPGSILLDARRAAGSGNWEGAARRIAQWRESAGSAQYLLVTVDADDPHGVVRWLEDGDVLLTLTESAHASMPMPASDDSLIAHRHAIHLGSVRAGADRNRDWAFQLPMEEMARGLENMPWNAARCPVLDRIARYVTFREVGVAMSVGAAAGFAHFGVLQCLETAGIPLDFLCGASMGGIAALACARYGNARDAARHVCEHGGANAKLRDPAWLPRNALLAGRKGRRVAEQLFGSLALADLGRPTAVVAADLVAGKPVVLQSGSAAIAARATAAIPGLFPPIFAPDQVLVDGAVVSRIPVDVLNRRRCGYQIAVTVAPERVESVAGRGLEARHLRTEIQKLFGFRNVVSLSWKLLGSWDSAAQAQHADQVISVTTPWAESFNFDSARQMVVLGERTAESHLPAIQRAVHKMLAPGTP